MFKNLRRIPVEYRAYTYRVLTAVAALATAYGLVTDEKAVLWLAAGSALLGLPLAAVNTPTPYRGK